MAKKKTLIGMVKGPQGDPGPAGIAGPEGAQGPAGPAGPAGSDASVTSDNVISALGYTPAKSSDLTSHTGDTTVHVTSAEKTKWNNKVNDMTIELYNGTGGNPKPVRFASFNYSTCGSENGIAAKISMVSGHGNGASYAFLQDVILRVSYLGTVEVDNFKYYGASTGTYDGKAREYGDIFWVVDETNKIVDFYCLMGQYSRVYQSPWKRLTYSTGGTVTQYTSCTVYTTGEKVWANNDVIATKSDIVAGGGSAGEVTSVNGKTGAVQITASDIGAAEMGHTHDAYLPKAGGTVTGDLGVGGKLIQGNPSGDSTVTSMNRFQNDLFIEGNGSAPNNPRVAGFYLGKSATDENRHLDIVSGDTYSYIDFNKYDRVSDYDVRLLVNVATGDTQFMWGPDGALTQKQFNVMGTLMQWGSPVALKSDIDAAIGAAIGGSY